MISRVRGTILSKEDDRVEVSTSGGVTYEIEVPLTVAQRLPAVGTDVELRTVHVVREDLAALYGFMDALERTLFVRLIGASGVGGSMGLRMLSTYSAPRLVRVLAERDIPALVQVSGIGKKTAEKLVLELSDRVKDLAEMAEAAGAGALEEGEVGLAQSAVQALVALGMPYAQADAAVRGALDDGEPTGADELIRRALART